MKKKIKGEPRQLPLIVPDSDWRPPTELPDLSNAGIIGLDTETRDDGLSNDRGPGWATSQGYITGVSVAWGEREKLYFPTRHPEDNYHEPEQVKNWLMHLVKKTKVKFVCHNAGYDFGWLGTDWGVPLPDPSRIEDTCAMAYMLDENRLSYSLDGICRWLGVPGKDEQKLREVAEIYGADPKKHLYLLPARFVGAYGQQDPRSTLDCLNQMRSRIEAQDLQEAYRLEADLIPLIVKMRRKGIRIDTDVADRSYEKLMGISRDALKELTRRLPMGRSIEIDDLRSHAFLERVHNAESIPFPRIAKTGNSSFTKDWMEDHEHWMPPLIQRALTFNDAANKFVKTFIMDFTHRGRLHAEVHQFKNEDGDGTRSFRFSYSNPPLQQMPERDEDVAPLVRGAFVPDPGEVWGKHDYSQQEYRLIVHFAALLKLPKVEEAVYAYRNDPKTDFHKLVVEMTGLERKPAKDTNFAKAFGAGIPKFASMIGKSVEEAAAIYAQYDERLPFVSALGRECSKLAQSRGYIRLIDGARSHFDMWEPSYYRDKLFHAACSREEAERRISNESHDWYGHRLRRAATHKAMNRLIQGSAARQTKKAMRECDREGILPLIQMHDELGFSHGSERESNRVHEIMRDVVKLQIPVGVKSEHGPSWGHATLSFADAFKKRQRSKVTRQRARS